MTMWQDRHRTQAGSHHRKQLDRRGLPVDAPDPGDDAREPPSGGDAGGDDGPPSIPTQDITEPNPTRIGER